MKSHEYNFSLRQLARAILPTLVVLAGLAGVLRAARSLGLMPTRPVTSDPHYAVLAHQSRAARSHHPAQIVLVGDSTCMADVDARALSQRLPGQPRVLNLGLLIWFDLNTYAEVLSDFASANPGQVRVVLLLVTPEKLALPRATAQGLWGEIRLNEHEPDSPAALAGAPRDWLGLKCLRENLLPRLLATPMRGNGEAAARFAFSSEIDAYQTAHDGSTLDLARFIRPQQPPKPGYTLAEDLEAESRAFRAKVPSGARLFVGLTPRALSYSPPGDRAQRLEMLTHWNRWVQADTLLTNLPAAWPDPFFASKEHLNELGQKRFTALLARELAPLLQERP
jgi:hypothetical protein